MEVLEMFLRSLPAQTVTRPARVCLVSQVLDGRIHEQVKDYLVSMCQTELDTYQVVHTTFNQLLDSSKEVSRTPPTRAVPLLVFRLKLG